MSEERGLYIVLISIHGLIRGSDPELGRDADTGGQVQYVLDLARALSDHPDVGRVELMTRQVLSINVDYRYGEHLEQIADRAWIVRLPCGPHRYLRKEALWPHLPQFVDHALQHFRQRRQVPDVVHSHYADAGLVGVRLAGLLETTLIHTGHSLGRSKRQRLLDKGSDPETIEKRYRMSRRIAAEERVLEAADLVVASTRQEVDEQWGQYPPHPESRMIVIPPGVDLDRFSPPRRGDARAPVEDELDRYLRHPERPLILALQRPDERKNLATLIRAYGSSAELREAANLALVIGARDDISELPAAQRRVLTEMLLLIDRHDLYGSVAYPKSHHPDDVPDLYRAAARRHGVFVNPALTEPFGLTLLEAAASGLPVVATEDGGPRTIIAACNNGLLVDPLDHERIAAALLEAVGDRAAWRRRSQAGLRGVRGFSWRGHVERYLEAIERIRKRRARRRSSIGPRHGLVLNDHLLVCDIDNTLTGDREALAELVEWLDAHRGDVSFGIATGRTLRSALDELAEWGVPRPDLLVTAVGSEVHYGHGQIVEDVGWRRLIDHRWDPHALQDALRGVPGLRLQPRSEQRAFKLSYLVDPDQAPPVRRIARRLRDRKLEANVIYSHGAYLDLLPARASKGAALRYVAHRWGLRVERLLVAGDSGNDEELLTAGALGVVVGNHSEELAPLRGRPGIYFAEAEHARGVLEGIEHHGFAGGSQPSTTGDRPA
ncbi:MAG: HAD-IIB family hydrolase [Thermoanaerobaculales bacterium]|jgi:sucrose-phosphate synthase|nr:HAD-IIB family hydrolase [Thermoanaerobaculales bacterium]